LESNRKFLGIGIVLKSIWSYSSRGNVSCEHNYSDF